MNHSRNQNFTQHNKNNVQQQAQTPMEVDHSSRSRQNSSQPMSISQRFRNNHIANMVQDDVKNDEDDKFHIFISNKNFIYFIK